MEQGKNEKIGRFVEPKGESSVQVELGQKANAGSLSIEENRRRRYP